MRKCSIIFILCFVLLLCSCSNGDTDGDYIEDFEERIKVTSDIDFGYTAYNIETDSQNYFDSISKDYAATADGYYTCNDFRLCFIDRESCREAFPVCTRANCLHNDTDCDSYFNEFSLDISYYEKNLYTVLTEHGDSLTTYWLYKISLDGSRREKLFYLYSTASPSNVPTYIIHRGYVYFKYDDGENCHFMKSGLDGSNQQEIFRTSSQGGIWNISGYGDGVLFCATLDNTKLFTDRILYYSQTEDELYKIAEKAYYLFAATEDSIIYTDGNNLLKTNIEDLSTEVFAEGVGGRLTCSYDGQYIYVDNELVLFNFYDQENSDYSERKIDVYSRNGSLVDTIRLPGQKGHADFGDEAYLFLDFYDGREYNTYRFDKSQIGTGNYEWVEIENLR